MKAVDELFCNIHDKPGLYGIFSLLGFGERYLVECASQMLVKNIDAKSLIINTYHYPEFIWHLDMELCDLKKDGIFIMTIMSSDETFKGPFDIDAMKKAIENTSASIAFIHLSKFLVDSNTFNELKKIAEELSISIVVMMGLSRNVRGRKPRLFDLVDIYRESGDSISGFVDYLQSYEKIILLHRDHDIEYDLAWGSPCNLSDMTELTVFDYPPYGKSLSLKYNIYDMVKVNEEKMKNVDIRKYFKIPD